MKITTLLGSPRPNGNTATVLKRFEELASAQHSLRRFNLREAQIHGCLSCMACQRAAGELGCVQKDDALPVFDEMLQSDLIVYATPLYAWDFTAQLKVLMDRQFCLIKMKPDGGKTSLLDGKKAILLVTCGGPVEGNADLIQQIFRRAMDYAGCKVVGMYILPGCTTPSQMGERGEKLAERILADIN